MVLLLRVLIVVLVLAVWIYCVMDVARTPAERARHLHKLVWLAFVVLLPAIGSLAWLLLGRDRPLGSRLMTRLEQRPAPRAPDDSPEFLATLDDEIKRRRAQRRREAIDDEIERLEEEFRDDADES